jgi:two-component system, sporulation sensor kinase A
MSRSIVYPKIILENFIAKEMNEKYDSVAAYAMGIEGEFIYINAYCESLLGYPFESLRVMQIEDLVKAESLEKVVSYYEKAKTGRYENFDCQFIHFNGNIIDINIIKCPIIMNGETVGVYGVLKDITELKQKRQKMREQDALFQLLTEQSLDLITKANNNGELMYVSPYCTELLGYTPEELKSMSDDIIHEEDRQMVIQNRELLARNRMNGRITFRVKHKGGHFIWVESLCKAIINEDNGSTEIISVIRDISERKRAEDELLQKEETYRGIVEHSPDAIVIAGQGEILFANDTAVKLLGAKDKSQLIGKHPFDFLDSDYFEIVLKRIKQVELGKAVEFIDQKIIRLDGEKIEVEVKIIPTIYQNLSARHIIIRDISERKKTQELLLNSEKLSVAGQLAAGIAHEVRNPLTAIKGFLRLMENQAEFHKNYFEIIQSEINRIELILSELLMLSKPQDMKFKSANLLEIIQNVKALIDTYATMNSVQIVLNNYSEKNSAFEIVCDENQLKQVFINFLKNAIEAMPKGGNIYMNVMAEEAAFVKVQIKDEGNGIPEEYIDRIGQPFFTTKDNGTGLGLMINMKIIENHQGTYSISSNENGTLIELKLPYIQPKRT